MYKYDIMVEWRYHMSETILSDSEKQESNQIWGNDYCYKDVKLSVSGIINDKVETINYEFKNGKGSVEGDDMAMFMLKSAMEENAPVGPVGEKLDRDLNNPLAMLFLLKSDEIFQSDVKVELISGDMPEASDIPDGAIA